MNTVPLSNSEPLLIAVDAALQPASVAVMRGQQVIEIRTAVPDVRTDAWLSPAIDDCLSAAGLELAEINGFAVTIGPGTFTGIRVGLATCLGLAAPRHVPVAGVLTLEALAAMGHSKLDMMAGTEGGAWVAPCIDARRGQVYGALYHIEHLEAGYGLPLKAVIEPTVVDPSHFLDLLSGQAETPLLIGTGTRYYGSGELKPGAIAETEAGPAAAEEIVEVPAAFTLATMNEPLAAPTGRLVASNWRRAGPTGCHPPEPVYIRPADARLGRNPLLSRT